MTTQAIANTGHQLHSRHGLTDKVVHPTVKSLGNQLRLLMRGEHQNRQVLITAVAAQFSTQI